MTSPESDHHNAEDQAAEVGFEVVEIPREDPSFETDCAELIKDEEWDEPEKDLFNQIFAHAKEIARVPEVRGIVVEEHDHGGVRFVYVVDEFVPNTPETSRVMDSIGEIHHTFASALPLYPTKAWGFCRGDFDGYIGRVTKKSSAPPESSGNDFVDFVRAMSSGYKPLAALKFV